MLTYVLIHHNIYTRIHMATTTIYIPCKSPVSVQSILMSFPAPARAGAVGGGSIVGVAHPRLHPPLPTLLALNWLIKLRRVTASKI